MAPRAGAVDGGGPMSRTAHSGGGPAGDGPGWGTTVCELSSGAEPGAVVGAAGHEDSLGVADRPAAAGLAGDDRRGRNHRTPERPADSGQGPVSGRGAVDPGDRGQVLRP